MVCDSLLNWVMMSLLWSVRAFQGGSSYPHSLLLSTVEPSHSTHCRRQWFYEENKFHFFSLKPGADAPLPQFLQEGNVRSAIIDQDDNWWVIKEGTVYRQSGNDFIPVELKDARVLFFSKPDRIWIFTDRALYRWSQETGNAEMVIAIPQDITGIQYGFGGFTVDRNGDVWLTTDQHELLRYDGQSLMSVDLPFGVSRVYSVVSDVTGKVIYITTEDGIFYKIIDE
jgi:hypothetical protein